MAIVVSHFQINPLLEARRAGKTTAETSADLGMSKQRVALTEEGIVYAPTERIDWEVATQIAKEANACFLIQDGGAERIRTFSDLTDRPYSLYPTRNAPTMLVAGFPMHRIKDTDPMADTQSKIDALGRVRGQVLDTATGLGYTAIKLAKNASHVMTIELDPAAQEIASQNPWSGELFANPKIEQRIGDAFIVVPEFERDSFDAILHDPPTMALAGELYSEDFYRALFRVLKRRGKLFHYVGDPESKSGRSVTRGVMTRLRFAGFTRVEMRANSFGVLAIKA